MSRFGKILALAAALALLAGCAKPAAEDDQTLHVLATTYPVYLFTTAVVGDTDDIEVDLLVNAQTSCLHDYTLSVKDMKAVDRADVIIMNGLGLEDFMADALTQSSAVVIDASARFSSFYDIAEGEEADPHIWMFPDGALFMLESISQGLTALLPEQETAFRENYDAAFDALGNIITLPPGLEWITFHDGFSYFSGYWKMDLLKAIEEEEGATASAAEIKEIVALIEEHRIPAIFVEKNGSRKTADVIARETGCQVCTLDMLMSGEGTGIQPYVDAMNQNISTVWEALK